MKKITSVLGAALALAFSAQLAHADQARDGNWWRTHNNVSHVDYILGFFDGMNLGESFSVWKYTIDKDKAADAVATLVSNSYDEMTRRYMTGVTANQLVDGLDAFYVDFRNRNIRLNNATWLVLRQISGVPMDQLHVENWRQSTRN
jgi:hypothetical protein